MEVSNEPEPRWLEIDRIPDTSVPSIVGSFFQRRSLPSLGTMSMSLRKLQPAFLAQRAASIERCVPSPSPTAPKPVHRPSVPRQEEVRTKLKAIEAELLSLVDWEDQGTISSDERRVQTSQLLSAKLPMLPSHGPEALEVLTKLEQWKGSGYVSEEECSTRRLKVLSACSGGGGAWCAAAPMPSSSFSRRNLTVSTTAPATEDSNSPPSAGAHTRNVLLRSCFLTRSGRRSGEPDESSGRRRSGEPDESSGLHRSAAPSPASTPAGSGGSSASPRRHSIGSSPVAAAAQSVRDTLRTHWPKPASPVMGASDAAQRVAELHNDAASSKVTFQLPSSANAPSAAPEAEAAVATFTATAKAAAVEHVKAAAMRGSPPQNSVERSVGRRFSRDGLRRDRRPSTDAMAATDELQLQGADLTDLNVLLNTLRKGEGRLSRRSLSTTNLLARAREAHDHSRPQSLVGRFALPVFDPDNNRVLTIWQLIIFAFVVTSALVVPLMVAFESDMTASARASLNTMDTVFDVAFIFDILVSMNIAFRKDGFLIKVRSLIVAHYLRTWFALDFVSSFPLSWFLPKEEAADSGGEFSRINRLLRLMKLGKLLVRAMQACRPPPGGSPYPVANAAAEAFASHVIDSCVLAAHPQTLQDF